jgi:hypothetical protein
MKIGSKGRRGHMDSTGGTDLNREHKAEQSGGTEQRANWAIQEADLPTVTGLNRRYTGLNIRHSGLFRIDAGLYRRHRASQKTHWAKQKARWADSRQMGINKGTLG